MGGRGGSGGGVSRGGSALSQKMPELTGSEKQIKWAKEILESVLVAADAEVRNAERHSKYSRPDMYNPSVEGAKFARNAVVEQLKSVTQASKIIDARRNLTQNNLRNIALEYDRRKKMKK